MEPRIRIIATAALGLAACSGGGGGGGDEPPAPVEQKVTLVAASDLGLQVVDRETSVFMLLPPFSIVRAQVLRQRAGWPTRLLDQYDVDVTYEAVADPLGSINSTSVAKTDFWQNAQSLLGLTLAPGEGLLGEYMPADAPSPGPQPMGYSAGSSWFQALGIPVVPYDDAGLPAPYPLLRVTARHRVSGQELAHLDVVVPVSDEVSCAECHVTGAIASSDFGIPWSNDPDPEVQAKRNVLLQHDANHGTTLYDEQPVLCVDCHYSVALDIALTGPVGKQKNHRLLSRAMHSDHGVALDLSGQPLFPSGGPMQATCYRCHPGQDTQFARGAMTDGGLGCHACHGDMLSVGGMHDLLPGGSLDGQADGLPRRPWIDVPRCQSCHSGDALGHLAGPDLVPAPDGIRLLQAWRTGDPSASPLLAVNKRFAENDAMLYRFSRGHGGLLCSACHGSAHAEWPNADAAANDNLASIQLQGHAGVVSDCTACHVGNLPMTLSGPHGLHPVGDERWVEVGHGPSYDAAPASCQACHGLDLAGTVLSRAATDRSFTLPDGSVKVLPAKSPVGCADCHAMP